MLVIARQILDTRRLLSNATKQVNGCYMAKIW